ncbi:MAG TPA: SPOR domain-containing protein, partial [Bacillota bacterium]|nr:SPOR domain-containing protein [Bacillota bacterium]
GHAKGIAIAFNLKPKQTATSSKSTTYRVIAGSFRNKKNADQRAAYLKSKGIASYVTTRSTSNPPLYRVQAGAFKQKKGADKQVNTIEQIGIKAFVVKN